MSAKRCTLRVTSELWVKQRGRGYRRIRGENAVSASQVSGDASNF